MSIDTKSWMSTVEEIEKDIIENAMQIAYLKSDGATYNSQDDRFDIHNVDEIPELIAVYEMKIRQSAMQLMRARSLIAPGTAPKKTEHRLPNGMPYTPARSSGL